MVLGGQPAAELDWLKQGVSLDDLATLRGWPARAGCGW